MAKGLKGLYQNALAGSSKVLIETRGIVNPPRMLALAMSSARSGPLGGLIGGAIGGLFGGNNMRALDMVFPGPGSKRPIIKAGRLSPGKKYYVRETPYPSSPLGKILSGQQSIKGALISGAAKAVRGLLNPKPKAPPSGKSIYGEQYNKADFKGDYFPSKKYSTEWMRAKEVPWAVPRSNHKRSSKEELLPYEQILKGILDGSVQAKDNTELDHGKQPITKLPYVLLQQYGDLSKKILLPATISGLSETVTPEWQSFRYVGSPFQTHRYGGVERSIKFDLKPYAFDMKSRENVMDMLDKLRRTAFPDENIAQIKYGNQVIFGISPNLYYLTIYGYYKKVLGIITDVSISVDDSVPWPSGDEASNSFYDDKVSYEPFPVAVNVSLGMKVVEDIPMTDTLIKYKQGKKSNLTGKEFNPSV